MLGVSNGGNDNIILKMAPLIIVSLLITWLLQRFRRNYDLLIEDSYIRKMQHGIPKIPDVFYQLYSATLVFLIVKILIILKIARESVNSSNDTTKTERQEVTKTIIELSIYGLSIITFMLIMAMQIVTNFYITQG